MLANFENAERNRDRGFEAILLSAQYLDTKTNLGVGWRRNGHGRSCFL